MNELIPIRKSKQGYNVVSARELHQLLEVGTRFNDWFSRRVEAYRFVKYVDYTTLESVDRQDYSLSLTMAQELCIRERSPQTALALHFLNQYSPVSTIDFSGGKVPPYYRNDLSIKAKRTEAKKKKQAMRGTYFLACKKSNAVKIGTTYDIAKRIKALQASNPMPLELLLFLPINVERQLHTKFKHLRIHLEWFSLNDEILAFIEEVKTGVLLAEFIQ